jgi:hypothetical protein
LILMWIKGELHPLRGCSVTPLGVKHALASKALVIIISYMVIIACNIDPFNFRVEKQLLKTPNSAFKC